MPSFDILSEIDSHEVQNAFDQTEREINQRFDFRGTQSFIKKTNDGFELSANSDDKVKAIWEVLRDKFVKRKLSLKFLEHKDPVPAAGSTYKINVVLKKGIDKENAKKLVQLIKNQKNLKVTPSIQGEAVRVTGKKKDDLQEAMAVIRQNEFPLELSFANFRE
ncbi:MAG: YajQ family cyclic di-GMP-binding protein [Myxococcales bacterium]|nr:YajQ family cyclic di-GMP-binding protein [Myxococcales bacterium]USN51817.1 MAG: YajQ family cyclic di-GMP-binding protein [Myxococcales bacterium]